MPPWADEPAGPCNGNLHQRGMAIPSPSPARPDGETGSACEVPNRLFVEEGEVLRRGEPRPERTECLSYPARAIGSSNEKKTARSKSARRRGHFLPGFGHMLQVVVHRDQIKRLATGPTSRPVTDMNRKRGPLFRQSSRDTVELHSDGLPAIVFGHGEERPGRTTDIQECTGAAQLRSRQTEHRSVTSISRASKVGIQQFEGGTVTGIDTVELGLTGSWPYERASAQKAVRDGPVLRAES